MGNIEVERNFDVPANFLDIANTDFEFVKEKSFTDTYFDTMDHTLGKQNIWLRKRDDTWELKTPTSFTGEGRKIFEEIVEEKLIIKKLGLLKDRSLKTSLQQQGFASFGEVSTSRKLYTQGRIKIVIDNADFGEHGTYIVGEAEIEVKNIPQVISEASDEIDAFLKGYGLLKGEVESKIFVLLQRKDPRHRKILLEAQQIES